MKIDKYKFEKLSNESLKNIFAGHKVVTSELFVQKILKHKKHFSGGNSHGFGSKSGGGAF